MNNIYGLEKMSLVDYDGYICATIFLGGSNFRCLYCHNASLVLDVNNLEAYTDDEVFSYLEKRKNILDAVCISGGEPTLAPNLEDLIDKIRSLGYLVKLDTNGSNPKVLKHLIDAKKIDYIAMDVKSGISNYRDVIGVNNNALVNNVLTSIELIKKSNIDYEFRTTLVKEFHGEKEVEEIGNLIKGAKHFFFQKFVNHGSCIKDNYHEVNINMANKYLDIIRKYCINANLRGY